MCSPLVIRVLCHTRVWFFLWGFGYACFVFLAFVFRVRRFGGWFVRVVLSVVGWVVGLVVGVGVGLVARVFGVGLGVLVGGLGRLCGLRAGWVAAFGSGAVSVAVVAVVGWVVVPVVGLAVVGVAVVRSVPGLMGGWLLTLKRRSRGELLLLLLLAAITAARQFAPFA